MEKQIFELDELVLELEVAQEKLSLMIGELNQDYFDLRDDWKIKWEHDRAAKKTRIAFDYVLKIENIIDKIREMINMEVKRYAATSSTGA